MNILINCRVRIKFPVPKTKFPIFERISMMIFCSSCKNYQSLINLNYTHPYIWSYDESRFPRANVRKSYNLCLTKFTNHKTYCWNTFMKIPKDHTTKTLSYNQTPLLWWKPWKTKKIFTSRMTMHDQYQISMSLVVIC